MKLTIKQKRFADEYIISGNATEAAILAGYSERTARSQGQRLLTNVDIAGYMRERTEKLFNDKAMTVAEALAISASIARGEPLKYETVMIDSETDAPISKEIIYQSASAKERNRAIEHILKVNGAFIDKQEVSMEIAANKKLDDIISQLGGEDLEE